MSRIQPNLLSGQLSISPTQPQPQPPTSLSTSSSPSSSRMTNDKPRPAQAQPSSSSRTPRFYLPSRSGSSDSSPHTPLQPLSRVSSRTHSDPDTSSSNYHSFSSIGSSSSLNLNLRHIPNFTSMTSPQQGHNIFNSSFFEGRRRSSTSRASIGNLRSALELYQVSDVNNNITSISEFNPLHLPSGSNSSSSQTISTLTLSNAATSPTSDPPHQQDIGTSHSGDLTPRAHINDPNNSEPLPLSEATSNSSSNRSSPSSCTEIDISTLKMDALVDIHRVLYRGKEDLQAKRIELTLKEEARLVRKVVERWFEGDCVYDQPFVHLSSRESLLTHFALLHTLGTVYLPSLSPIAMIIHIGEIMSLLQTYLFGSPSNHQREGLDSLAGHGLGHKEGKRKSKKVNGNNGDTTPRPNPGREENLLGLGLNLNLDGNDNDAAAQYPEYSFSSKANKHQHHHHMVQTDVTKKDNTSKSHKGWWKFWDIVAECKEIGEMECYDGHYLAMIEQVIHLSLLPTYRTSPKTPQSRSNSHPSAYFHPKTPNPHFPHLQLNHNGEYQTQNYGIGIPAFPLLSFAKRILGYLVWIFECWLDWELRINTMIQFNEVGKVTYMKDVIDIRDLVESIIPFAKKLRWISKVIGYISSTLGAIILFALDTSETPNSNGKDVMSHKKRMVPIPIKSSEKKGSPRTAARTTNIAETDGRSSEKPARHAADMAESSTSEKTSFNFDRKSSSVPMRIKSPIFENQNPSRGRKLSAPTPLTSMSSLGFSSTSGPSQSNNSNSLGLEGVASASTSYIGPNVDQE